jgi:teichuronic acid biosynthesis glycosyltransferase TuaG
MPAYNAKYTISESISSALSQSYTNIELLIVDDGSDDGTIEIIKEKKDFRVKLLSTQRIRSGPAAARNIGLSFARGEYIAFLDADDLWHVDKISVQLCAMIEMDSIFSCTGYARFYSSPSKIMTAIIPPKNLSYKKLLNYCSVGCLTVIFKHSSIPKFSFLESEICPKGKEDWVMWLKIIKHIEFIGGRICVVPTILAYYRISRDTISSNKLISLQKQWYVLRTVENLNPIQSLSPFFRYALTNGLIRLKEILLSTKNP